MDQAVNYQRYLHRLVRRAAKPGQTIVDFGAGRGGFAHALSALGFTVQCIEADEEYRQILSAGGLTCHRSLDDIPDATVDYLYSLNVLEHIEDDLAVLRLCHRKLRPGAQLLLYASYVDLLPGALWKYHNIRYFSWGAPYALLFVALAVAGIRRQWAVPRGRAIILTAVAGVLVLSAVRLRAVPLPAEIAVRTPTRVVLTPPSEGVAVDFIDLKGIGGTFTDLYFGTPSIRAAGQEYRHIQHFRLIPTDFGARLVAFRPLRGPDIVMNLDPRTPLAPDAIIRAYRCTFGVGAPAWLTR